MQPTQAKKEVRRRTKILTNPRGHPVPSSFLCNLLLIFLIYFSVFELLRLPANCFIWMVVELEDMQIANKDELKKCNKDGKIMDLFSRFFHCGNEH